jgi:hypothetical protein
MASPSTVITMGFGSFGSVNLLPTLGYGIGAASTPMFGCGHALSAYLPGGTNKQQYSASGTNKSHYKPGGTAGQKAC